MTTMMVLPASSVEDLVARTGGDGDGGGAVLLDGKSHNDHMVPPASAGVEEGKPCVLPKGGGNPPLTEVWSISRFFSSNFVLI